MTVNIISVWNLLSSIVTRHDRSGLPLAPSKSKVIMELKKILIIRFNDSVGNSERKVSNECQTANS